MSESKDKQDSKGAEKSSVGWDALFPDLADASETAQSVSEERAVGEERGRSPQSKGADDKGPKISSWQPAMDTQEGVVASVPAVKSLKSLKSLKSDKSDKIPVKRPAQSIQKQGKGKGVEGVDSKEKIERSRVFAGSVLSAAVVSDDQAKGPYAPVGFDPRPEHVPLLAAIFSGIAPGAGQVYNGQDDLALKYGLWFWLVRPWIAGVHQARDYGGKVRDYQVPRPDETSLLRALRYAAGWYAVIIVLAIVTFFGISTAWETWSKRDDAAIPVDVAEVVERAVDDVRFARMSGFAAVNKFLDEQNSAKQEFTMTAQERAHRLYVVGYSYCVERQYSLCEATMRRVTSLGVQNRDAYRLQAWASMQIKEGGKIAMPEISEVPTLFEFELLQENDPDRDIVQPAVDLMLNKQDTASSIEKGVDDADDDVKALD